MQFRILVVDDDRLSLGATSALLESRGYVVDCTQSGEEAILSIGRTPRAYALVILDYRMEGKDGALTAQAMLSVNPEQFILIHSGDSSREAMQTTWRAGAISFVDKDEPPELFLQTVENWCTKFEQTNLCVTAESTLSENSEQIAALKMVGRSAALAQIAEKVKKYSGRADNVLILGETGTGKEHIARALHQGDESTFFAVNCASYSGSSDLMESDLFGYVKGAFTGAQKDHTGIFESARGGTVFLDEIHTLERKAQQRLLRVIQERTVRPLGSVREYKVAFRLIAAAKPELEDFQENGDFLPDLFERLNVLKVNVPSLQERPEDIAPLVAHFCEKYQRETGERKYFLHRTLKYLESYPWPRNVRELENTVKRLCVDTAEEKIAPEHLDAKFFGKEEASTESLKQRWDGILKKQVEEALSTGASQREAARKLGMPESSLRNLLKRFSMAGQRKGAGA